MYNMYTNQYTFTDILLLLVKYVLITFHSVFVVITKISLMMTASAVYRMNMKLYKDSFHLFYRAKRQRHFTSFHSMEQNEIKAVRPLQHSQGRHLERNSLCLRSR